VLGVNEKAIAHMDKKTRKRRRKRLLDILGTVIGFFVLAILWFQCILYLRTGNFFGHKNYLGQPVGTILLLIILTIITPIVFIKTWQIFFGKKEEKAKITERPKWMEEPPWRFPWE